jgi:hypothetical protein
MTENMKVDRLPMTLIGSPEASAGRANMQERTMAKAQ